LSKRVLLSADIRVGHHELIVAVVSNVLVQRHHVNVLKADIYTDAGLTVPEKVRQLFAVRRVVGRLELASCMKILEKYIRRRIYFRLYAFITVALLIHALICY